MPSMGESKSAPNPFGDGYPLGQGLLATVRLNLIHELWQKSLKFLIHPNIKLPTNPTIADVCTGTACWAIDTSQERPDALVHAFDLTLAKAPPTQWLPQNIRLGEWDIFEDPPAALLDSFDVLHIRLIVFILSGVDPINPVPILRRFKSLLKPGGWLQWEDLDPGHIHVKCVDPDMKTPNLDGAAELANSGGRNNWLLRLPELLSAAGFVAAQVTENPDPDELSKQLSDTSLMSIMEMGQGLIQQGQVEKGKSVVRMVEAGYEESLKGAAFVVPRLACVARKPY